VRTLRFGTIQKKSISIINNNSGTIGIYLTDHMKERKTIKEETKRKH
jgi:hypothetical protein